MSCSDACVSALSAHLPRELAVEADRYREGRRPLFEKDDTRFWVEHGCDWPGCLTGTRIYAAEAGEVFQVGITYERMTLVKAPYRLPLHGDVDIHDQRFVWFPVEWVLSRHPNASKYWSPVASLHLHRSSWALVRDRVLDTLETLLTEPAKREEFQRRRAAAWQPSKQ